MSLDIDSLAPVALWRYEKRNGSPQFDSDKVEDDDVAYTAVPAAQFAALVAELRAAREALAQVVPDWLPESASDATKAVAECAQDVAIRLVRARLALAATVRP